MKTYLALIRMEIRLAFRQKIVIFFNYLMPLIFFFVFAQSMHAEQGGGILQVVTMVSVIGILGNGLFGAGMRAVQERESNILRRYKVAPITPLPLLVASTVTGLAIYIPYVILMLTLAQRMYGMVMPGNLSSAIVFIMLGLVAMRSIGLIIAAVVNSMQESQILVQVAYILMLFLSGATFPTEMFPSWLLTATQFMPATWLMTGLKGIFLSGESLWTNWQAVGAMVLTAMVGLLISMKLFRWEKEEKLRPAAKLWVLAVLTPFVLLGTWQVYAKDNVKKTRILSRELSRTRTSLIRNARIFVGNGTVIENGAVLVKDGRIAEVFDGAAPDPDVVKARPIEAAGKTLLPGLIEAHAHLGSPGGVLEDWKDYEPAKEMRRALAAYLYCGVTAVRSAGDTLDGALTVRELVNGGERLGSEFFMVGPMFTADGGHGTEYFRNLPTQIRQRAEAQFIRAPKNANEANKDVAALKRSGVDGIKAVLESGAGGRVFNRLDLTVLKAVGAAARANGLPLLVHTGDARDVEDALAAGANAIEHGSFRERIPDGDFALMAKNGVTYDPTLSVGEAFPEFAAGRMELLNRSLVQQVARQNVLAGTKKALDSESGMATRKAMGQIPINMEIARDNLLRAWKTGVRLVTGSDAGNMLVFHGPTVQHEVALWVEAGIPVAAALQAATLNGARALGVEKRMGSVEKGKEATLLMVDGNPLTEVKALESVSMVMFKGEYVNRGELFRQE